MNDLLSDVLREHAARAPQGSPDLDTILSTGNRRVRRARVGTGIGALAVAGVLGAGLTVLPGLMPAAPPEGSVAATTPGFTERKAGYAVGRDIHWGDETFTVDAEVVSYVQTDDGFVYATRSGEVRLFDGSSSTAVGEVGNSRLVADDSGSLVAWVDGSEGGGVEYVVFDTAARSEVARVADEAARPTVEPYDAGGRVLAVDDGSVYWTRAEEVVRYDVSTGDEQVLATGGRPTDQAEKGDGALPRIDDVASGRFAYALDGAEGTATYVGAELGRGGTRLPVDGSAVLSPDGRYVGVEGAADETAVLAVDGAGGKASDVSPRLDRYAYWVVYGWSGAETALVLAIADPTTGPAEGYAADFLTCEIGTGHCEVAATGLVDEATVLPVGRPAS